MSLMNAKRETIVMDDGREIIIETGKLAKQAHGSAMVRMGDTMILATAVSNYEAKEGLNFLPLSVDYQEKFASSGKIPGGFLKREGRLSDHEVLICRLVDRVLRPLFPSNYRCETQVMISLMSSDKEVMPDALAALAASAALTLSDIPFAGPISEVRVGRIDGKFIINPIKSLLEESDLDIMLGGTEENISMVEGELKEVSEEDLMEAMKVGHEAIKKQCKAQKALEIATGKTEKREVAPAEGDEELAKEIENKYAGRILDIIKQHVNNKHERSAMLKALKVEYIDALPEEHEIDLSLVSEYFGKTQKKVIRDYVLSERKRMDGRNLDEIRQIESEVGYLPSTHGSALFTRGETQSISTVTLGTKLDEQLVDGAVFSGTNKFMLHYNFPGFSTGEAKPNRGPGRREVGHGNLAMRALKNVLPQGEDNPYTVRIVSDILESNGSSSMATVCAGCMALMDAGLKIAKPVSGIAMGLISDSETGKHAVLSDILGDEDQIGDMDFKVTGTKDGITACQMDIKVDGLSYEVLGEALKQAREGRLHILNEMSKTIAAPNEEMKPHAPRNYVTYVEREMIGAIIGPGGKVIQELQRETGTTIVVEEIDNQGKVSVFGEGKDAIDAVKARIKGILAKPELNEVYTGKVKTIMPYGAFVEILPGKDGLLHISEVKWERVENLEEVLTEGEEVKVKLIEIDRKTGKLKLSRKVLLPRPEKAN